MASGERLPGPIVLGSAAQSPRARGCGHPPSLGSTRWLPTLPRLDGVSLGVWPPTRAAAPRPTFPEKETGSDGRFVLLTTPLRGSGAEQGAEAGPRHPRTGNNTDAAPTASQARGGAGSSPKPTWPQSSKPGFQFLTTGPQSPHRQDEACAAPTVSSHRGPAPGQVWDRDILGAVATGRHGPQRELSVTAAPASGDPTTAAAVTQEEGPSQLQTLRSSRPQTHHAGVALHPHSSACRVGLRLQLESPLHRAPSSSRQSASHRGHLCPAGFSTLPTPSWEFSEGRICDKVLAGTPESPSARPGMGQNDESSRKSMNQGPCLQEASLAVPRPRGMLGLRSV